MNPYLEAYEQLLRHFGPQGWWPAETPFEVMVGAVLTQNTSWSNVERAIVQLRDAELLQFDSLLDCSESLLAELIRPSGYYNLKARRLKNLLVMIAERYGSDLEALRQDDLTIARANLLSVKGIGPETADSILLYACDKPIFVIDAYTHRVFLRHNLVAEETDYHSLQEQFSANLPLDVTLFNEYHALIVKVAVKYCKKSKPQCGACPLQGLNW